MKSENTDTNGATTTTKTTSSGMGMGRRRFMHAGAAGAGALAVGAGSTQTRFSPIGNAAAVVPLAPIGIAAGGAALGYLTGEAADLFFGDEKDLSGYTGADALHTRIEEGALAMKSADERVMTSIENNISYADNITLAKAKVAIVEALNAGKTESEASNDMQTAVDEHIGNILQNIVTHWNSQSKQLMHHVELVANHADLTATNVFAISDGSSNQQIKDVQSAPESATVTVFGNYDLNYERPGLINSSDYDTRICFLDGIADVDTGMVTGNIHSRMDLTTVDGSTVTYLNAIRYQNAWTAAMNQRDSILSDLTGFVTDVYAAYEAGEIDLSDVVDPVTAATELQQNQTGHHSFQGAHAAMLGIPTNKDASLVLEIATENGPVEVSADIYTSHVPTDADGNKVGFQVGQTYSPSTWKEPLFITYETSADSADSGNTTNETSTNETGSSTDTVQDFVQLKQDFKVLEAFDAEGNDVESFQTVSRNQQTADVASLEEELKQIREEQLRMQEEASAGGGGFLNGDGASLLGLGAVGALVAVLLGKD